MATEESANTPNNHELLNDNQPPLDPTQTQTQSLFKTAKQENRILHSSHTPFRKPDPLQAKVMAKIKLQKSFSNLTEKFLNIEGTGFGVLSPWQINQTKQVQQKFLISWPQKKAALAGKERQTRPQTQIISLRDSNTVAPRQLANASASNYHIKQDLTAKANAVINEAGENAHTGADDGTNMTEENAANNGLNMTMQLRNSSQTFSKSTKSNTEQDELTEELINLKIIKNNEAIIRSKINLLKRNQSTRTHIIRLTATPGKRVLTPNRYSMGDTEYSIRQRRTEDQFFTPENKGANFTTDISPTQKSDTSGRRAATEDNHPQQQLHIDLRKANKLESLASIPENLKSSPESKAVSPRYSNSKTLIQLEKTSLRRSSPKKTTNPSAMNVGRFSATLINLEPMSPTKKSIPSLEKGSSTRKAHGSTWYQINRKQFKNKTQKPDGISPFRELRGSLFDEMLNETYNHRDSAGMQISQIDLQNSMLY